MSVYQRVPLLVVFFALAQLQRIPINGVIIREMWVYHVISDFSLGSRKQWAVPSFKLRHGKYSRWKMDEHGYVKLPEHTKHIQNFRQRYYVIGINEPCSKPCVVPLQCLRDRDSAIMDCDIAQYIGKIW